MPGPPKEEDRRSEDTQEAQRKLMENHFKSHLPDLELQAQHFSDHPRLQRQASEIPAAVDPILRAVRQRIASNGWKRDHAEIDIPKIIDANTIIRSSAPSS